MDPFITAPCVEIEGDRVNPASFLCMENDCGQRDIWLSRLSSDYLHPGWAEIDAIFSRDADGPAMMWHKRSSCPEFMAAVAFRLSDDGALRALPFELTVLWLTIPLPAWEKAATCHEIMWKALLGDDDGSVQASASLKERMRAMQEIMPALTTTMDWIGVCRFGLMPEAIIETALAQSSSPTDMIYSLWIGDENLLQKVLLRTHSPAQIWPSSMIGKRAIAALRKRAPEVVTSLICPGSGNGDQSIFWPFPDDHKAAVVKIPVLMGLWAMTGVAMDWWHKSGRLRQVAEIHAFDPLWFNAAYNQGVKIALAYGQQLPHASGDV